MLMPAVCRYCCKSPKLPGGNFPATRRSHQRAPILVASVTLPRSPVSFSSSDEVPHIFARKSRLQPAEFLITCAKRLLQQYLPGPDVSRCKTVFLLDDLIGGHLHDQRHREAERLGGLAIDGKRELRRQLDRQVGGLSAV